MCKPTKFINTSGTFVKNIGVRAIRESSLPPPTWLLGILCEARDATCSRPCPRSWARDVVADPWLEPGLLSLKQDTSFLGGHHFTNINWNIWSIDLKYLLWSYLSLWPLISQVCVSFHIGLPRMMLFYMPPVLIKCDLAWYRNTITNISHDSQPLV